MYLKVVVKSVGAIADVAVPERSVEKVFDVSCCISGDGESGNYGHYEVRRCGYDDREESAFRNCFLGILESTQ